MACRLLLHSTVGICDGQCRRFQADLVVELARNSLSNLRSELMINRIRRNPSCVSLDACTVTESLTNPHVRDAVLRTCVGETQDAVLRVSQTHLDAVLRCIERQF